MVARGTNAPQKLTQTEAFESLTGEELDEFERLMGNVDISEVLTNRPRKAVYVLVFLLEKRNDKNLKLAEINKRTLKDLNDFFEPEPDEAFEDEPESEVGKG